MMTFSVTLRVKSAPTPFKTGHRHLSMIPIKLPTASPHSIPIVAPWPIHLTSHLHLQPSTTMSPLPSLIAAVIAPVKASPTPKEKISISAIITELEKTSQLPAKIDTVPIKTYQLEAAAPIPQLLLKEGSTNQSKMSSRQPEDSKKILLEVYS